MTAFLTKPFFNTLFLNKDFVSAQIVHARGNQLDPELLLKLSVLCLHNEDTRNICTKKFYAKKLIFDKMTALWT